MSRIYLGTGVLSWNSSERHSGRYGTVILMAEGCNSLTPPSKSLVDLKAARSVDKKNGSLYCYVTETRDSTHHGDSLRNIRPERPERNSVILLGTGRGIVEWYEQGGVQVGVKPFDADEKRQDALIGCIPNNDGLTYQITGDIGPTWLDVEQLYRAHEQTVELYFQRGIIWKEPESHE